MVTMTTIAMTTTTPPTNAMDIGDTTQSKKPCSDKANHILSAAVKTTSNQHHKLGSAQRRSITAFACRICLHML